jgi:hypothetical protein
MPPIYPLARVPHCQVSAACRVSPRFLYCEGHGAFFVSPIADDNAQGDDIHGRFGRRPQASGTSCAPSRFSSAVLKAHRSFGCCHHWPAAAD